MPMPPSCKPELWNLHASGGAAAETPAPAGRPFDLYRAAFDAAPCPMWVCDYVSFAFQDANRAAIQTYGFSRDEFLAMTLFDLHPPEDVEALRAGLNSLRSIAPITGRHYRQGGGVVQVELNIGDTATSGRPARVVVALDVTERRKAEDQTVQSRKMEALGRLAGGVAHDFNNHLTVINGYADLLIDYPQDPDRTLEMIREVRKAGERAADLTRQLLAFGRRRPVAPTILDLNAVLLDMCRMFRRVIGEDVGLVTDLQPDLASVQIDTAQFEQVVMNLVVNARDAMPDGGTLLIATRTVSSPAASGLREVVLEVTDTGVGMTKEIRERVFEPFFSTKGPEKGTGLGLATVYSIVKQAEGSVEIESAPGVGTTFRIILPGVDKPSGIGRSVVERLQEAPRGTETVLLVEDEVSVCDIARQVLETQGYTVLEARDADGALQTCETHDGAIHLLVTDVILPGMNGHLLAEHFLHTCPDAAVLCITGYDRPHGARGPTRPGVKYLQKPFSPSALARRVREVLDSPR